ncbi:MAG: zinc-ribbon domain-containing protein [Desulfobacterales bacterium]|nr:zinc-ribbon domain-containing protein [Desulfobacterales bacterium]MDD4391439.1 zinc-ribbon domain-containing protein [Desulfobacterales bacterium]
MNAQCPNCQTIYHIDDSKLSDKGTNSQCPKCQKQFSVKKEPGKQQCTPEAGEIVCPKCEHIQLRGVECEKCGLIFAKYKTRLTKELTETGSKKLKRKQNKAERSSGEQNAEETAIVCSSCGKGISPNELFCPRCGEPSTTKAWIKYKKVKGIKHLLGIAGSIVLFVGVFMPIVKLPIVGYANYFHNGRGGGGIILAFALVSAFLSLTHRYKGLWCTGFGSLAMLAFTTFHYLSKMTQIKKEMNVELEGNPFKGFADAALESVELQWGWAVLVVGAALLVASAAIRGQREESHTWDRRFKTSPASVTVQVKAIKKNRLSILKWAGIGIIISILVVYMINLTLERRDESNVSVDSRISFPEDDEQLGPAFGFRGIKWGTYIYTLKDIVPDKEPYEFNALGKLKDKSQYLRERVRYSRRKVYGDVYTIKNDVLEIKHVGLEGIYYIFWLDKFYGVLIESSHNDYEDILGIYQDKYGEFSFESKTSVGKKEYEDFEINIKRISDEYCEISYWFKPILNERNENISRYYKNKEKKEKKLREAF